MSERSISPKQLALAYLLGAAGVVIFGATLPVTVIALQDFSPWFVTFGRAFIAGLVGLVWFTFKKQPLYHAGNRETFIAGICLVFGFPGFMALGMQTVPASHGGVILGFLPLATAAIARLITSETPSPRFWALSVVGAVLVAGFAWASGSEESGQGFAIGDFWLLLAGICAATGYVVSGKLSREMSGYAVILRALILTFPIVAIGTFLLWEERFWSASSTGIIAMLYLGLGSMCFGFFAWNTAMALGGIARIGQIQLLQIFVTLAASAWLLAEPLDGLTVVTAIVVTVLIALTRKG